ncbi:MAG: ribonuclease HII [Candidatus Melainabacteria bacterium LEY3_CP_29_8]|nr:MAG: ribonuclease HII [Candidatus Melainabacteria bacterium LEY3_CP_29_8]
MNIINNLISFDKQYNYKYILGVDEAGRGPGAGDVFAACVCFDLKNKELIQNLKKLNDSKKLSQNVRNELYQIIVSNSTYSVNQASVNEIDKYNILNATFIAMAKSVKSVISQINTVNINDIIILVDGNKKIKNLDLNMHSIIKGDSKSASIAAASILAKVSRDNYMIKLDNIYPNYNWKNNKGYLTKEHLNAIDKYGMVKYHRKSFLKKHFESKSKQLGIFK